jgi:hypothetical protein
VTKRDSEGLAMAAEVHVGLTLTSYDNERAESPTLGNISVSR